MYITYEYFLDELNKKIVCGQDFYNSLLETVIKNPHRYTGIFRISSVKTKLIQNVTQSNEIKFGDFIENITTKYIELLGYTNLIKRIKDGEKNEDLNTDQLFLDNRNNVYLIEQKIRDDHDSTKKRGQFENFVKKIQTIRGQYPHHHLICSMWFVDDNIVKNKNYYKDMMSKYNEPDVEVHLYYGKEIWYDLFHQPDVWDELTAYLERNKLERTNEILNIPDFDDSEEIFIALKQLPKYLLNKLMSDRPEYIQLRKELFPNGKNLKKIT